LEDRPILERMINVKDLVTEKVQKKTRRIDQLIQMQQSEENQILDFKIQGLV